MPSFPERLADQVRQKGSPLVLGLDPRPEHLPRQLAAGRSLPAAVVEFHRRLLELAAPMVPCVKPQVAFFEAMGHKGYRAYETICSMARELGLLVIADVKRADIGTTAEAYASAHLGIADAVTVQPWLGSDSLTPFLARCRDQGKGLFVLVRTSNPGASRFQDLRADGLTLSQHVALAVDEWGRDLEPGGRYSPVGAVVGATAPGALAGLRASMPRAWILMPGIGPQGGRIEDLAAAFDPEGLGGLVAVSRAVSEGLAEGPWEERVLERLGALGRAAGRLVGSGGEA